MKQGNVGVEMVFKVKDRTGTPIDLTTATQAKLVMLNNGVTRQGNCEFVDRTGGVVRYITTADDLAVPGQLSMELEITFANGNVLVTETVSEIIAARLS